MAGVQTNSLAMALERSIRLGGSGSLQAISLFRQTLHKNSLTLIMYAEISPAWSNIDATVDRMTAIVHSNISLRSLFSRVTSGRNVLGRKEKVSPTRFHL